MWFLKKKKKNPPIAKDHDTSQEVVVEVDSGDTFESIVDKLMAHPEVPPGQVTILNRLKDLDKIRRGKTTIRYRVDIDNIAYYGNCQRLVRELRVLVGSKYGVIDVEMGVTSKELKTSLDARLGVVIGVREGHFDEVTTFVRGRYPTMFKWKTPIYLDCLTNED